MKKSNIIALMKMHKITKVVDFHSIKCHMILFTINKEYMSSVVVTKLVLKLLEIIFKIN